MSDINPSIAALGAVDALILGRIMILQEAIIGLLNASPHRDEVVKGLVATSYGLMRSASERTADPNYASFVEGASETTNTIAAACGL